MLGWEYFVVFIFMFAMIFSNNKRRKEEESMSQFINEQIAEYEFKIIRGLGEPFKKREILERLCKEERLAGWELFEKLDNQRVRFKRPISARTNDSQLKFDAYRTQVGWLNRTPSFIIPLILVFLISLVSIAVSFYIFDSVSGDFSIAKAIEWEE